MIIVLNPFAGGGSAEAKWQCIQDALPLQEPVQVYRCGVHTPLSDIIRDAVGNGERDFIAAGGDGTVNALVNALMPFVDHGNGTDIRCGAIGLGSSNDFHKPLDNTQTVGGIPYRVNVSQARPRDIGVVRFRNGDGLQERFFLINASVGVTAFANDLFNHPDAPLRLLKGTEPGAAILYAAARTILSYRNRRMILTGRQGTAVTVDRLTNLGIMKSPHVSGGLRYDCSPAYTTGSFKIYLAAGLGIGGRLRLLSRLSRGEFRKDGRCCTWESPGITVDAREPFAVEVDGEVITTTHAAFAIVSQRLKVCP